VSEDTFLPLQSVKIYNVGSSVKLLFVLQILILRAVFDERFNLVTRHILSANFERTAG
jgi:hypothetical protein